jgi:hypothetical protein
MKSIKRIRGVQDLRIQAKCIKTKMEQNISRNPSGLTLPRVKSHLIAGE